MAHGGHSSGGGHAHYHGSRSGGKTSGWEILISLGIVIVMLIVMANITNSRLSGKQPLKGSFQTYQSYLIDEEEYFSETDDLISGLRYVHEKLNVQVVLMSSSDSWSDSKAVEKYYELFDDEAHVLIICPTAWYSSNVYYAIGDLADTVIDDYAMDHLLDNVDKSRKGSKWKKQLVNLADRLLEPKE